MKKAFIYQTIPQQALNDKFAKLSYHHYMVLCYMLLWYCVINTLHN